MVVLGRVKVPGRHNLCVKLGLPLGRLGFFARQSQLSLLFIVEKDDRLVLLGEGPAKGTVVVPKDRQQFLIGDLFGVKNNLDRLRMIAQIRISGRIGRTSGIANLGADNAWNTPEPGVWPPESP
jgi:hypothetical protein